MQKAEPRTVPVQRQSAAQATVPDQSAVRQVSGPAPASPASAAQRKLIAMIDNSRRPSAQRKLIDGIQRSPVVLAQRKQEALAQANRSGLPDQLKAGIERLSGMSMDHVKVHYKSSRPAQLNALAYAQGSDIHVAPGQEKHVPHEAWHVVQQAQGRVKPTMQMKGGAAVNDDAGLEREADSMGAKAVQMSMPGVAAAPGAAPLPANASHDAVAQLVLATVNPQNGPVNLQQTGGVGGAFSIMENTTQPDGNEVSNAVGFTGVLNAADWANLGKSPADYWRAHGYAKSFGGAGDGSNVGWWKADSEKTWTDFEQQVRGAGMAQIPAWLPGTGETGTYMVDRVMHQAVLLKNKYVTDLMKGVDWGMSNGSAAWVRAIASCNDIYPLKARETRIVALQQMKDPVVAGARGRIQTWVDNLFGQHSLETNLIKTMEMTYAITAAGVGPGVGRRGFSKKISSPKPDPKQFGLKNEAQAIWAQLVTHNTGIFAQGNSPLAQMVGRLAYAEKGRAAQELRAHADGWGV